VVSKPFSPIPPHVFNALLALIHQFMERLEVLNVNENKLRYLPNNIGESHSIRAIHACSNTLMELPDRSVSRSKAVVDHNTRLVHNRATSFCVCTEPVCVWCVHAAWVCWRRWKSCGSTATA
jgi:hypothetical protein